MTRKMGSIRKKQSENKPNERVKRTLGIEEPVVGLELDVPVTSTEYRCAERRANFYARCLYTRLLSSINDFNELREVLMEHRMVKLRISNCTFPNPKDPVRDIHEDA